jgi:hypothetical protein
MAVITLLYCFAQKTDGMEQMIFGFEPTKISWASICLSETKKHHRFVVSKEGKYGTMTVLSKTPIRKDNIR